MNHISASPHPQIKSEVHLIIRENADYFRNWVKTDFSRWHRREFQKHYLNPGFASGTARSRNGRLMVYLDFTGPALPVIDRIAATFPDLQITDGTVWETARLTFESSAELEGVVEYEFADENGIDGHGPTGHFDRRDDLPETFMETEANGYAG